MENGGQCQRLEETEATIPNWSWLLNDIPELFVTVEISNLEFWICLNAMMFYLFCQGVLYQVNLFDYSKIQF